MRSAVLFVLLLAGHRQTAGEVHYRLDETRSRFTFDAASTMGSFHGRADRFIGSASASDTIGFSDARGSIRVSVADLHTGIGMRDGHLRSDLDAREYPDVEFVLDSVHGNVLIGRMTLHGADRPKRIPALLRASGDTVSLAGDIPMKFTEFGLKPPSRLMGMARVHDDWMIHFNAFFIRER